MIRVRSDALDVVGRSLGLSGQASGGVQETELEDGRIVQTLPIDELIRRGRTFAASLGIFTGVLDNVHAGSGSLSTTVDPFNFGTGVIPPFPDPITTSFDLWLLSANVLQISGTGTMTATLELVVPGVQQGFGVDDSGVAIVAFGRFMVAFWDEILNGPGGEFGLLESGQPAARLGYRLPRGCQLSFSSIASALATFRCHLLVGLFPIALGQDAVL